MQLTPRQQQILDLVARYGTLSISGIKGHLPVEVSIPTLNRELAKLVAAKYLTKTGRGRATSYDLSPYYKLFAPIGIGGYFELEPDQRGAQTHFNPDILTLLAGIDLFTPAENTHLEALKRQYQRNISNTPNSLFQKELERLTIELSWKSSQIEGNTYSLLETERLFREKVEAEGKSKADAIMLLNHKDAFGYLFEHQGLAAEISLRFLEEIHSLLIKDLGVGRNLRSRSVGITGTAYKPLDNKHQIREVTESMCAVINGRTSGFEKALLAVVLISYIQPFEDGNKRTGRMIGNALLIADGICPLSYRSVDSLDYKKAMLLFYEKNNLAAFKRIFIEQIEFSATNYFQ